MADALSATAARQTRESTVTDADAALPLVLALVVVLERVLGVEVLEVVTDDVRVDEDVVEGTVGGRVPVEDEDTVFEVELETGGGPSVELALAGGGVADPGLARAPVPQGIASFDVGWMALAGGTLAPVVEAMVKRVAHCLSGEPGAVNW